MNLKTKIMSIFLIFLILASSGCAFRGTWNYGPLNPVADLYSRHSVAATPTFVGNFVGFVVATPIFLITFHIDSLKKESVKHSILIY